MQTGVGSLDRALDDVQRSLLGVYSSADLITNDVLGGSSIGLGRLSGFGCHVAEHLLL
jgi:hypothetical protein